jgi:hypothetical protein
LSCRGGMPGAHHETVPSATPMRGSLSQHKARRPKPMPIRRQSLDQPFFRN